MTDQDLKDTNIFISNNYSSSIGANLKEHGFKNIYDVSQWIPHHPGGTSIFQGIEANNHYKNKKLYPDSPTDLFNGVHYHKEENAMEKYLQKKNNYVKLVGRLK